MADPYLTAWWRARNNRARSLSYAAWLRDLLLPLTVAGMLVPLVRPTFLGFLDLPQASWGEAVFGLVMRASMVVVGFVSLDVYTALVRGPTRDVLAILPVDPALLSRAELVRTAAERWWMLPSLAIVLAPVAQRDVGLWAAMLVALMGSASLALTASAAGHLLAIHVAESPAAAPLLDALRGNNPRPQAAFLYAPGAVLVAVAGALYAAASAVMPAAAGDVRAGVQLLVPFAGALAAYWLVPALARSAWFRGSIVLSEIDARYASLVDPAEASSVYLDWVPRLLPASWRPFALNDLRHGWRSRRSAVVMAWLLAALSLGLALGNTEEAPFRSAAVAVAAAILAASNGVLMSRDEPPFLRVWLGSGGASAACARATVLLLWAAPPVLISPAAIFVRHGGSQAGVALAICVTAALGAAVLALVTGMLRERGVALYAAASALLGAAVLSASVWSSS